MFAVNKGAFYAIDRDDDGRYNLIVNSSGLTVTDEQGNAQTVSYETGAQSYLAAEGEDWYNIFKTLTPCRPHLYSEHTESRQTHERHIQSVEKSGASLYQTGEAATTTYTLTIDGVTHSAGYGGADSESGLYGLYVDGAKTADDQHMSTVQIAEQLKAKFDSGYYTSRRPAPCSGFAKPTTALSASGWQTAAETTTPISSPQKRRSSATLPTIAPDGYIARVIGDVGSNADDYFVMFSTDKRLDNG